jgi:thiol-disulfide isomerase/thioredoxin
MVVRIRAPEFPPDFDWIGTQRPLKLADLRGHVVILDFWTYCCINCMHVLPVLAALEEKRREEPIVVIGVHSAKFDAEGDLARIREAMARHGVRHPVVVDRDHRVWDSYAIRSWPTLVVIGPDGSIASMAPGEADLEPLDSLVGKLLDEAREAGALAALPLSIDAPSATASALLSFPGKVIALTGDRLAVADSGHHRVLILDREGAVQQIIGTGDAGLVDGHFGEARLRDPQGLAHDPESDILFVADRGNHAIREADLTRGFLRTTAGTGTLGRGVPRGAVPARLLPLRSPWDVALAGDFLLVAMAGTHQIWAFSRIDETIGVFAGSGREGIQDGPLATAALAQPSGLALDGHRLYFADSETSAVRYLDLVKGEVRTLVGSGLFDFGDADGPREVAQLQHPVGISSGRAGLLVADTFNGKIRSVDSETGAVRTWFQAAGDLSLTEPAGLCQLADGRVVVADTNGHRLVEISPDGEAARILDVRLTPARAVGPEQPALEPAAHVLRGVVVAPGDITLRVRLESPEGFDLAEGSRVSVLVTSSPPFVAPADDQGFELNGRRRGVPILLKGQAGSEGTDRGAIELRVEATLCGPGDGAACWPVSREYRIPFRVAASAPSAVDAAVPLPDPRA